MDTGSLGQRGQPGGLLREQNADSTDKEQNFLVGTGQ